MIQSEYETQLETSARLQVEKLPGLDSLRFLAAMMIALHHLAMLPPIELPSGLSAIKTHFAFGVPLFFALSAFSMCVGTFGRLHSAGDIKSFYMRRFFRIAPLFYVVIALYIPFRLLTGGQPAGLALTFTNTIFIFNFIPSHVGGAVPAAWSIGTEMAFYLVFPIIALWVTNSLRFLMLAIATVTLGLFWEWELVAVPGLRTFASYSIFSQMCYFTAGIGGFFAWRAIRATVSSPTSFGALLLSVSVIGLVLLVKFGHPYLYFLGRTVGWDFCNYLVKVSWAAALVTGIVGIALCPLRLLVNGFTRTFGQASFSLYLLHPMIIIALMKSGMIDWIKQSVDVSLTYVSSAVTLFVILLPASMLFYKLVEVPGMRLIRTLNPEARLPTAAVADLADGVQLR